MDTNSRFSVLALPFLSLLRFSLYSLRDLQQHKGSHGFREEINDLSSDARIYDIIIKVELTHIGTNWS